MKVTAFKRGYFGRLREAGDTFSVPDEARASWFGSEDELAAQAADTFSDESAQETEGEPPRPAGKSRKKAEPEAALA